MATEKIGPIGRSGANRSVLIAQEYGAEWFATKALGPCLEYITVERLDEFLGGFPEPLRSEIRAALPDVETV